MVLFTQVGVRLIQVKPAFMKVKLDTETDIWSLWELITNV